MALNMNPTPFQREWIEISKRLGLDIEISHEIALEHRKLTVPVRLLGFGAANGMLLVTDYDLIRDAAEHLVNLGYGYSCLSEPSPGPIDWESVEEMLQDWGPSAPS
jgi:hypothetical protein